MVGLRRPPRRNQSLRLPGDPDIESRGERCQTRQPAQDHAPGRRKGRPRVESRGIGGPAAGSRHSPGHVGSVQAGAAQETPLIARMNHRLMARRHPASVMTGRNGATADASRRPFHRRAPNPTSPATKPAINRCHPPDASSKACCDPGCAGAMSMTQSRSVSARAFPAKARLHNTQPGRVTNAGLSFWDAGPTDQASADGKRGSMACRVR